MKVLVTLAVSLSFLTLSGTALRAADKPAKAAQKPTAAKKGGAPKPVAPSSSTASEIKDPIAVVDGAEINQAELDGLLGDILAREGKSLADVPPDQKAQIYRMLLDEVIVQKIVSTNAASVKVTDEEVAAVFEKFRANFPSEEELKAQIAKSGETLEGMQQSIRKSLQAQHWVDAQMKGKIDVADADAEAFYKANPEKFEMPERVRASHILIRVPADAKPEEVIAKQKAAQAVLERLKKGEPFEKLAEEVSEDPSAKQNKGDLDFFPKEQMVPEFSAAAFKLKKGELALEPVRSEFGYHVIKVTDRKAAESITLEIAKPDVLAFLKQQKRETEMQKLAAELRAKAEVKINLPPAEAAAAPVPEPAK